MRGRSPATTFPLAGRAARRFFYDDASLSHQNYRPRPIKALKPSKWRADPRQLDPFYGSASDQAMNFSRDNQEKVLKNSTRHRVAALKLQEEREINFSGLLRCNIFHRFILTSSARSLPFPTPLQHTRNVTDVWRMLRASR
jgi:hypothetical protein